MAEENKDIAKRQDFIVSKRAQEVSEFLSDAARLARFSSRVRRASNTIDYSNRRGAKILRVMRQASFLIVFVIPSLLAGLYFFLFASNQYLSEAKFTVSSAQIPKMDGLGSVTGIPSAEIYQSSEIIVKYIESRALLEALDKELDLRHKYGTTEIDWWARFNTDKPIERFLDYWNKRVKAEVTMPAGIIRIEVSAFSPGDAKIITQAIVAKCEALINDLNSQMRKDTVSLFEGELVRTAAKIKDIQIKMEELRNKEGLIKTQDTIDALNKILVSLETDLLSAKKEVAVQMKYVDENAPQIKVLVAKIETLNKQITQTREQLTIAKTANSAGLVENNKLNNSLSKKIKEFAALELDKSIAEQMFSQASNSLEMARIQSDRQMMYLHKITTPAAPEEQIYTYPYRILFFLLSILLFWGTYSLFNLIAAFIRDRLT